MEEINKHIKKINSLSYNAQCKHVKTKLLSFKTKDVPYTMFFKKLYILLDKLPWDLKETNIEIDVLRCFLLIYGIDLKKKINIFMKI